MPVYPTVGRKKDRAFRPKEEREKNVSIFARRRKKGKKKGRPVLHESGGRAEETNQERERKSSSSSSWGERGRKKGEEGFL